ncbi:hypothetical protein MKX01_027563 [Papaver californicum]|nr:hypothetical protein MKX01_027563 [Papaver californicum]
MINTNTKSDPFINDVELIQLDDSVYNITEFGNVGLSLVARNNFGYPQTLIRYPDDPFGRMWKPSGESYSTPKSVKDIDVAGFWNLPPLNVFETALTTEQENPVNLDLQWPTVSLPNSTYYIALYFADGSGAVVFASRWPLSGSNTISLIPVYRSVVGLLNNAGEIFNLLPLGGRTLTRDATAMEYLKNGLQNPPVDWNGDPCIPREYAWTGVTCSEGPRVRVIPLNLTSMALSGYITRHISNMTALTDIWLGSNSLTGTIPDLGKLRLLKTLTTIISRNKNVIVLERSNDLTYFQMNLHIGLTYELRKVIRHSCRGRSNLKETTSNTIIMFCRIMYQNEEQMFGTTE